MKLKTLLASVGITTLLLATPAFAQKAGQAVPLDKIPAAITAAIEKAYPKSTIVSAATMSRGAQERYQISLKTAPDAATITVLASPDGTIRANKTAAATTTTTTTPPTTTTATTTKRTAPGRQAPAKRAAPQDLTIAIDDLPKAVTKAIKEAYPKDEIIGAQKVAGAADMFLVALNDVSSVSPLRVFVTADGKIQKR